MFHLVDKFCNGQLLIVKGCASELQFTSSDKNNNYKKIIDQYWKMIEPEYNQYSIFKQGEPEECIASWAFDNKMTHQYYHPTLEGHIKYASLIKERLDSYNE
jgi:hypothetical protein